MLGRFIQPDTIIPQGQGVQAWDRYAYANNNAIRYNDPSGHMATDDGGGAPKKNEQKGYVNKPNYVETEPIRLKGGPGPVQDGYTGYSTSGAGVGWVDIPDLVLGLIAAFRDSTNIGYPDVEGQIYFDTNQYGLFLTGATISNNTNEAIAIGEIDIDTFASMGGIQIASQKPYPSMGMSIQSPGFGVAQPGQLSGMVPITSHVAPGQYSKISMTVITPSGRTGMTTAQLIYGSYPLCTNK